MYYHIIFNEKKRLLKPKLGSGDRVLIPCTFKCYSERKEEEDENGEEHVKNRVSSGQTR